MIIAITPLSMAETKEHLAGLEQKEELVSYIHKFTKLKLEEAQKMKAELTGLELIKAKPEHLIKVIDLLPEDISDIHKIFSEISLNEDEAKKILEVVKRYK